MHFESTQPSPHSTHHDTITIRALSSITSGQADLIARTVQAGAPAWVVADARLDQDREMAVLVVGGLHGPNSKPSSSRATAQLLELETHNDDMTSIASFTNVAVLSAPLLDLIA